MKEIQQHIEAILMASVEPVSIENIALICNVEATEAQQAIDGLTQQYLDDACGFAITKTSTGYRFVTSPDCYDIVSKFITEPMHARLSPSAMETLAVIAYKQPVSRGQIASIRGVNVDSVIKTLESRGYIQEIGRDSGPGQAILYGTSPEFLERLGITSISELPSLGDFVPDASIMEQFEKSLLGEATATPSSSAAPTQ
jgi:segregation and condensation protein B